MPIEEHVAGGAHPTRSRRLVRRTRPASAAPAEPISRRITPPARYADTSAVVLRREQRYRYALMTADLIAVAATVVMTFVVLGQDPAFPLLFVAAPVIVLLAKVLGLYDRDDLVVRKTTIEEVPRLFQAATFATLFLVVIDERVGILRIGDGQAAGTWLLLTASLVGMRMLARRGAGSVSPPERCLVLGDVASATELRERTLGRVRVEVVGAASIGDVRDFEDLRRVLEEFRAERVIVAPSAGAPISETYHLVRAAKAAGVRVSVLPGVIDVIGAQVEFDDVFGMTLLGVRRFGLTRSSRAVKRGFDLAVAVPATLVALPVIGVCALLIRLDSPGGAFFRQERVGRDGHRFRMIKLRTMVADAEARRAEVLSLNEAGDGLFKIADDPRVTTIGRVLRRTHLDELPQLLNVLRGDMSIVGPRPLVGHEDDQITGLDRRRLELTPGMTGPWQILGSTRRIPMAEMVKLDYLYVASWSLWNDIKILLRTAALVARRHGV